MKNYNIDSEKVKDFVSEPLKNYSSYGSITFSDLLQDKFRLVELIQDGLSFHFFEKLKAIFPFTMLDWSLYLDISLKSLQRYSKDKRNFKSIHSEKIIELAEVIVYGTEVFEDVDKLRLWMDTPSLALGHKRPIDLVKNSYGKELVMRELTALEYGVFA